MQFVIGKIDNLVRIDRNAQVTRLKMEMAPVGTARIATQANGITGMHELPRVHEALGQVRVIGFHIVVVANDYEIAIAARIRFGDTHHTVERGHYRRACGIAQINAIVHTATTAAIVGGYLKLGRMNVWTENDCVGSDIVAMGVMHRQNVEILVQAVARHILEIRKQHRTGTTQIRLVNHILVLIQIKAQCVNFRNTVGILRGKFERIDRRIIGEQSRVVLSCQNSKSKTKNSKKECCFSEHNKSVVREHLL